MSEAEWLSCADPRRMLDFLRDGASDRKLRLFCCGCCRIHPFSGGLLPNDVELIEAVESLADGLIGEGQFQFQFLDSGGEYAGVQWLRDLDPREAAELWTTKDYDDDDMRPFA